MYSTTVNRCCRHSELHKRQGNRDMMYFRISLQWLEQTCQSPRNSISELAQQSLRLSTASPGTIMLVATEQRCGSKSGSLILIFSGLYKNRIDKIIRYSILRQRTWSKHCDSSKFSLFSILKISFQTFYLPVKSPT